MNLTLLFTLALGCQMTAARSYWSDTPSVIAQDEFNDGDQVEVSCTLPIDYRGGQCRLYRGDSRTPFKVMIATDYICTFHMSSAELLGNLPVGSVVRLSCDYTLQKYTSIKSDRTAIVVWGNRPSPTLSVSHRFVLPDDTVEVTCTPPRDQYADKCVFRRDQIYLKEGSCSMNLTGQQLRLWEKPTLLLPVNLGCTYSPSPDLNIKSDMSNRQMMFVVDVRRLTSYSACKVSVSNDQLEAFKKEDRNLWDVREKGNRVTITVTNK